MRGNAVYTIQKGATRMNTREKGMKREGMMGRRLVLLVPNAADVVGLEEGVLALNCFGEWAKVTRISYRGEAVVPPGVPYVGYYTATSATSSMSGSYKVGQLVRTVHASSRYTSAELDAIEREMVARGERIREVA